MHSIFFVPPAGSARGSAHESARSSLGTRHAERACQSGISRLRKHHVWCAGLLAVAAGCMAVALSGCGTIAGNANAAVSGTLVASANTLSFGSVALGQTATANVSLKNESAASVQISQVNATGPFSVAQNTMPVTVAAGGTYSVSVQFAPTAVGAATGSLTLTSNASSGNLTVSLSGTGAADATPTPTAPGAMISPAPGTELSGSSVAFTWSAGSGVTEYQLWLGTTGAGSQNLGVYTEAAATGNTVSATATGLPTDAATVYVRLLSEIGGSWLSTDYTYTAASVVSTPTITVSAVSCASSITRRISSSISRAISSE